MGVKVLGGKGLKLVLVCAWDFAAPLGPPLRGTHIWECDKNFRRAKSEWLVSIPAGPLGPGIPKIEVGTVSLPRLALPNRW